MKQFARLSLMLAIAFLLFAPGGVCRADTIYLKNGREIKGTVRGRSGNMLQIELYTGATITIPADSIASMRADSDRQTVIDKAKGLIRNRRYMAAAAIVEEALKQSPDNAELQKMRAMTYDLHYNNVIEDADVLLESGEFEKATALIAPVLQNAPDGETKNNAHRWLADAYHARAANEMDHIRYSSASDVLGTAVQIGIDDARIHMLIAQLHETEGRFTLAGDEYRIAVNIDPTFEEALEKLRENQRKVALLGLRRPDPISQAGDMLALGKDVVDRMTEKAKTAIAPPEIAQGAYAQFMGVISQDEFTRISRFISDDSRRFDDTIREASMQFGVDPLWIKAIIMAESSFDASAQSPAGAKGLMQLMDGTAAEVGVNDPLNPEENIMGGTLYFSMMLDRFDNNPILALAAYNAGPGTVNIYNGVPPYEETQNYIRKVSLYYQYFNYESSR